VNRTLNQLQKVFLLRNCSDSMFESRTRPCLLHQIKRCSAPLRRPDQPEEDYGALVADAERFPGRQDDRVQADLAAQMQAAEAMEFERAAALRDRIRALTQVQSARASTRAAWPRPMWSRCIWKAGRPACRCSSSAPTRSWGNRDFYPRTGAGAEEPEVLQAFLAQFYDDKEPPRLILLSHGLENPDLVTELLSDRAGRKVEIAVPQRGEKAELVENAARNARESLARRWPRSATQNKLLDGAGRGLRPGRPRAGSRSTTTATSRARMPWAA
jgi:excinuclease ABC subunit C